MMEGKRAHEETQSESLAPKRIRIEEVKDADDTTKVTSSGDDDTALQTSSHEDDDITQQTSSREDDEEFTVESDSNSEPALSDSEEDFSDYNEEDDDGDNETIIIKGVQGECKDNGEGKYSLHYMPNGREIKIITNETNIQKAIGASSEKVKDHLIPVFKLTGLEVSKDDDNELIVYAKQLSLLSEDYPECCEGKGQEHQHVCGVLLRIENRDEAFITTDLMETKP